MDMRLRFPELFGETGVNPYRLARDSDKRISLSTAYRLKRVGGKLHTYKSDMLDAICDVMGVEPGDLWEREPKSPASPAVRKRGGKGKRAAA